VKNIAIAAVLAATLGMAGSRPASAETLTLTQDGVTAVFDLYGCGSSDATCADTATLAQDGSKLGVTVSGISGPLVGAGGDLSPELDVTVTGPGGVWAALGAVVHIDAIAVNTGSVGGIMFWDTGSGNVDVNLSVVSQEFDFATPNTDVDTPYDIGGQILSLSEDILVPAPEPASAAMLVLGLAGLVRARHRA
jgi:hypothetical protein